MTAQMADTTAATAAISFNMTQALQKEEAPELVKRHPMTSIGYWGYWVAFRQLV
jgi:hypothetical protein